jgi:hypothetical protein
MAGNNFGKWSNYGRVYEVGLTGPLREQEAQSITIHLQYLGIPSVCPETGRPVPVSYGVGKVTLLVSRMHWRATRSTTTGQGVVFFLQRILKDCSHKFSFFPPPLKILIPLKAGSFWLPLTARARRN